MAQLACSTAAASGSYDLTALGAADWQIGGVGPAANANARKNVSQLLFVTRVGGSSDNYFDAGVASVAWSDGTPNTSGLTSFAKHPGLNLNGAGYSVTVPAGVGLRTLKLLVGVYNGTLRITSTLSDGSVAASPVAWTVSGGIDQRVVTIAYAAASDDQSLTVSALMENVAGGGAVHFLGAALSAATTVTAPDDASQIGHGDPRVVWSPGNWDDRGTCKVSNAPGAYAKLAFSGVSVSAKVDVSQLVAAAVAAGSYPIIRSVVDGWNFVDTKLTSASTVVTRSGLTSGAHTVEFYFLATDPAVARWGGDPVNAIRITGFSVDAAGAVTQAAARSKTAIFYGDSISEGWAALGTAAPAGNSALHTTIPVIAQALNAEYGAIAYSGQGYATAGGDVPAVIDAWDKFSSGRSRLTSGKFAQQPDYIFIEHGANGTSTQAQVQAVISGFRAAAPNARIFVQIPAGGFGRAGITAAATAAAASDARVHLLDLGAEYQVGIDKSMGNQQTMYAVDGLHRNGLSNARVAGGYIRQAQAILDGVSQPATAARTVTVDLNIAKDTPAASLSGLSVAFYDQATPGSSGAPAFRTEAGSTDSTGRMVLAVQSTLPVGGTGRVEIRGAGVHYNAPVQVS